MEFKLVAHDEYIVKSLVDIIATSEGGALTGDSYNTAIGCGVDELVKQNMRLLSQKQAVLRGGKGLLETAMRLSAEKLQRELDARHLSFNFNLYFTHARESLASAAKEMSELNRKLNDSREIKRVSTKIPVSLGQSPGRYEVLELGLQNAIEGMLATPTSDVATLNIETIRQSYPVEGEWFPFEVRVEDFLFVLDDDGSLFVATDNYPSDLLIRARAALHQLAGMLYL